MENSTTDRELRVSPHHGRERNLLRITNLKEFLLAYTNNYEYYSAPFKVLAELEDRIKFETEPDDVILIPYKDDGDLIFELRGVFVTETKRVVLYEYISPIS
jgi:hypothetical protein